MAKKKKEKKSPRVFNFVPPHSFSVWAKWSFVMLVITVVLCFVGVVESVSYGVYQPILTVDSLFIASMSVVIHLVVEYNDVKANSYLFLTSFIFTIIDFVWLISCLVNMGSGGSLNSGDRTFASLYNGAIQYNEQYVRICYVNPYSAGFYVVRFVLSSFLVGMEAVFFPRFLYLFQWSFKERIRVHDIGEIFRGVTLDVIIIKCALLVLLFLHGTTILFIGYGNVPPLYIFVDSPNIVLTSAFTFFLITNVIVTSNDLYRLVFLCFLCLGSVLSSMDMYNVIVYSGTSWLNQTGYFYDLKTQLRVGGFCVYEGDDNDKEMIKFAVLQEKYHMLNILYCLVAPGLLPYVVFKWKKRKSLK